MSSADYFYAVVSSPDPTGWIAKASDEVLDSAMREIERAPSCNEFQARFHALLAAEALRRWRRMAGLTDHG